MTIEELIEKLQAIANLENSPGQHDTEMSHVDADDLLLAFINDPRVTETYKSFGKWYA